jgi:putative transposase
MKRARFTGRADHRDPAGERGGWEGGGLARKHGGSEGTIYAWKAKFGGMSVSDAQGLR